MQLIFGTFLMVFCFLVGVFVGMGVTSHDLKSLEREYEAALRAHADKIHDLSESRD